MNVYDVCALLLYTVLTVSIGDMFLRLASVKNCGGRIALSYVCGQLIWYLLMLLAFFARVPADFLVYGFSVLSACWLIALLFASKRVGIMGLLSGWWFPLLITVVVFPQVIYSVLKVPLLGWDARSIWFFHAKAIFFNRGVGVGFFADAAYAWSHTDYPLLLPVQGAVVCFIRGGWSEMAAKSFLVVNFTVWLSLIVDILIVRGWDRVIAWCTAIIVMSVSALSYVDGYADNHYVMPFVLALLLGFKKGDNTDGLVVAGILATYSINVKNEALPYVMAALAVWVWYYVCQSRRKDFSVVRLLGWWMVPGLASWVLWAVYKAVFGISGDMQLITTLSHPVQTVSRFFVRLPQILLHIALFYRESGLGILLIVILLVMFLRQRKDQACGRSFMTAEEVSVWLVLLVVQLMIVAVYVVTPYEFIWHISTSLVRLMQLPYMIALALAIYTTERVCPDVIQNRSGCEAGTVW